jgi:hypothetical protein
MIPTGLAGKSLVQITERGHTTADLGGAPYPAHALVHAAAGP